MTIEQDREDILKLHKDWWEANTGLDIPRMQSVYPSGMAYLMFNANGHPYFGIEEKTKVWEWYQENIAIPEYGDVQIMRLNIRGDMAWLACECLFPIVPVGAGGTGSVTWAIGDESEITWSPIRCTEIYERDDGDGNPVWKMWHFHASPMPPEDEPRPAFTDTRLDRGFGGSPVQEPFRVSGV